LVFNGVFFGRFEAVELSASCTLLSPKTPDKKSDIAWHLIFFGLERKVSLPNANIYGR
jgi:hypothetical protein